MSRWQKVRWAGYHCRAGKKLLDFAGLQKVQSVHDINYIDPSMQGELVHVAGPLSNVPTLEDSEMGLAVQGTLLERVVEMYQWVEKSHKRKSNKRTITVSNCLISSPIATKAFQNTDIHLRNGVGRPHR